MLNLLRLDSKISVLLHKWSRILSRIKIRQQLKPLHRDRLMWCGHSTQLRRSQKVSSFKRFKCLKSHKQVEANKTFRIQMDLWLRGKFYPQIHLSHLTKLIKFLKSRTLLGSSLSHKKSKNLRTSFLSRQINRRKFQAKITQPCTI